LVRGHVVDELAHLDRLDIELHLSRFDLGEVQHIVDEAE
jgi:hypothetical protein